MTPDDQIRALTILAQRLSRRVEKLERAREREYFAQNIPETKEPPMTENATRLMVRDLCDEAAVTHLVSPILILSPRRDKATAEARQWVMLECYLRGCSLSAIGRAMKRDHTTVLHGVVAEAARRKVDLVAPA